MKTPIKCLVKSALFGVAVLGGRLAANAWTGEKQADRHPVNKEDGPFELRRSVNPMDCQPSEPTPCNGWISTCSANGVYQIKKTGESPIFNS